MERSKRKSTFVEKILNAPAGSIVYREPDIVLSHDNSARIRKLFEKMQGREVLYPERLVVVLDRKMTGTTDELMRDYNSIHDFMEEQQVKHFFDCDKGICHQVLAGFIRQGLIVVGSDSHTCTAGAFNCFAVGLNKTETAFLWKKGKMWFRVPETVKITLSGKLRPGVYAKDLALWVMGMLKEENVNYQSVEYHGEGVNFLSIADRMTIANVSAEMGVKNSVFPPDDLLADYLGDYAVLGVWADENACYKKELHINLEKVFPLVMTPFPENEIKGVGEVGEITIQEGLIGACSSGRIEDLRVVARLLRGKRLAPGFQLSVVPASREIYIQAIKEGLIDAIVKAGASVLGSSCGPCLGSSHMLGAETKRFISTTNSHSMRHMTDVGVEKYIASPATVAMTALRGKLDVEIAYPENVFEYWTVPIEAITIGTGEDRKNRNIWNYADIDHIAAEQLFPEKRTYKIPIECAEAMRPYLLAGLDGTFAGRVQAGDIILAGEDFGRGRVIKHAAIGLVESGIAAVIVKSVDRSFYRMAVNCGLWIIIAPQILEAYRVGDQITLNLEEAVVKVNEKPYSLPEEDPVFIEMIRKKGLLQLS